MSLDRDSMLRVGAGKSSRIPVFPNLNPTRLLSFASLEGRQADDGHLDSRLLPLPAWRAADRPRAVGFLTGPTARAREDQSAVVSRATPSHALAQLTASPPCRLMSRLMSSTGCSQACQTKLTYAETQAFRPRRASERAPKGIRPMNPTSAKSSATSLFLACTSGFRRLRPSVSARARDPARAGARPPSPYAPNTPPNSPAEYCTHRARVRAPQRSSPLIFAEIEMPSARAPRARSNDGVRRRQVGPVLRQPRARAIPTCVQLSSRVPRPPSSSVLHG